MKVLINSDNELFFDRTPKGETESLRQRMLRQIQSRGGEPVAIKGGKTWLDTLYASSQMGQEMACCWDGPITVMSADAFYTQRAIDEIFAHPQGIHFFGRMHHSPLVPGGPCVFAITFQPEHFPLVRDMLESARLEGAHGGTPAGSPFYLYRRLIGAGIHVHDFDYSGGMFVNISDFSTTFSDDTSFDAWQARYHFRHVRQNPLGLPQDEATQ